MEHVHWDGCAKKETVSAFLRPGTGPGLQDLQSAFNQRWRGFDGPGGRETPLYRLYGYVQRQRVWFLSLFGLK